MKAKRWLVRDFDDQRRPTTSPPHDKGDEDRGTITGITGLEFQLTMTTPLSDPKEPGKQLASTAEWAPTHEARLERGAGWRAAVLRHPDAKS
jgi:hypothetical protein